MEILRKCNLRELTERKKCCACILLSNSFAGMWGNFGRSWASWPLTCKTWKNGKNQGILKRSRKSQGKWKKLWKTGRRLI